MEVVKKNNTLKKIWISLGAIFVALIVAFTAYAIYVNNYNKIYPNTYVGDINLGGKTFDESIALLEDVYDESKLSGKTMLLTCNDNSSLIKIDNLGITFGIEETAEELMEPVKKGSLLTRIINYTNALFTESKRNPVLIYDEQALQGAINDLVSQYEVEPIEFSYQVDDNTLTINKPHAGIKVDRELVTEKIETEISLFEFDSVNMTPAETTPPVIDVDAFYTEITSSPADAKYEKVDGKVVVIPERRQCEVERSVIEDAIRRIEAGEEVVTVSVITSPANATKADLEQNLYSAELGSFSSYFGSSSAARAANVRLASSRINDIELMPGEIFSYNDAVGERTSENGFYVANVYVGNKVESGLGGGVCQPSSTLYSATLYANMEIVERAPHSLAVSYMPGGMDATVSYGTIDFKFKNSSEYPVKVVAVTDGGTLTCKILGYNPDNYSVEIERSGGGLSYHVTRVVYKDGVEIKRESMGTTTYGVQEKEEPEATPEPSANPEAQPTDEPSEGEGSTPADAPSTDAPTDTPTDAPAPVEPAPEAPAPEAAPEVPATEAAAEAPAE